MAIWDKVRQGIDKAGKAAQDVLDEGKLRIDAYRAREQADKAAEALGYAMFRAMDSGHELESAARDRLVSALRERENEAKRLETELAQAKAAESGAATSGDAANSGAATTGAASSGPAASGEATSGAAAGAASADPSAGQTGS